MDLGKIRMDAARAVGVSPYKLRSDMTRDQAERFDACVTDLTHDYLTRDSDWIARELGGVEVRTAGELLPWPEDDQNPSRIPVESLGRDQ